MSAQLALQQYEARYRSAADQFRFRDIRIKWTNSDLVAFGCNFIHCFNPSAKHETTLAPHGSCLPGTAKAEVETTTANVRFGQQPSANWIVSVQCPNFGDYGCCLINPERKRAT